MLILTGGAGFIGSAFLWHLNQRGEDDVLVVDSLGKSEKWKNLTGLSFADYMEKDEFLERWGKRESFDNVRAVIHLGACTNTREQDARYLIQNNYEYSKTLFLGALKLKVFFYYASSAATYGSGEQGFEDNEETLERLRPLNMYAFSKHLFDLYLKRNGWIKKVVGWKFFNVFGPNEYHKGEMRSVVHKAYHQIKREGKVKLFKSYLPEYKDGEQKRDFLYVKDCVKMMDFFLEHPTIKGIFNIGSGQASTWNELVSAVFSALGRKPVIEYIDMPEDLKPKYQYYTCAPLQKIREVNCTISPRPLEEAVREYVQEYLEPGRTLGS